MNSSLPLIAVTLLLLLSQCGCIHIETGGHSASYTHDSNDFNVITNRVSQGEIDANLKEIHVTNRSGKVRIVGSDSGPWTWSWSLTVKARKEAEGLRVAEQARIQVEAHDGTLRLETVLPESSGRLQVQSDVEVRVPRQALVRVSNSFGPVEVEGLSGTAEVRSRNGSTSIQDIGGAVTAESAFGSLTVRRTGPAQLKNQNGKIEASDIRGPLEAQTSFSSLRADSIGGPATLKNQNGRIEVVRSGAVQARTSFASLEVREVSGDATLSNQNGKITGTAIRGSVTAETSFSALEIEAEAPEIICRNQNGAIRIQARSTALTNLVAETSFAPMEVRLPATLTPQLEARTSFGRIESDFPVLLNPPSGRTAEMTGPTVRLSNQNGGIRVVKE